MWGRERREESLREELMECPEDVVVVAGDVHRRPWLQAFAFVPHPLYL